MDAEALAKLLGVKAATDSGVVKFTIGRESAMHGDKFGGVTPMSDTVGSGNALILRNGRAYNAHWSRPTRSHGTTWTVGGQEFPLAAGQVWILLVKKGVKADVVRAKG